MAPKDAKKRIKAEQNKKQKLQTTTDPTPHKTVSNCTPSLKCKCSMQIKILCGANNLFYLSKNSSLNHCHHPHLKSKAILCGQRDMETGDIDILTLLFSVNVTPTQISQIMEHLKGPEQSIDHILNHNLVCEHSSAANFVGTVEKNMQEIKEEFNKVVFSICGLNIGKDNEVCFPSDKNKKKMQVEKQYKGFAG
jgi:hypothetical protein